MRRSRTTYARPAPTVERERGLTPALGPAARRIATKAAMNAKYDIPFNKKQKPTPTRLMSSPATPGPTMRELLNDAEFNAMALIRSRFSTRSAINACRPGMSNAAAIPSSVAAIITCVNDTTPASATAASASAMTIAELCVTIKMRRFGKRSATTPPRRAKNVTGSVPNIETNPT